MVEALFFLTVCLPSDPNACLSDKDPTFNNKLEDAIDAVEEVFANIETVERTCTCGCKMITITHLTTPSDGLAQTETEVKFDVRSSGGNTQLATFRGPQGVSRGFVSLPDERKVSLPHTVVLRGLTQLDTLEFTVFEEGGLDCSGSTFGSLVCSGYVVDTSVGSIGPGDWYRNACTNYPESFKVTGVVSWKLDHQSTHVYPHITFNLSMLLKVETGLCIHVPLHSTIRRHMLRRKLELDSIKAPSQDHTHTDPRFFMFRRL